MLSTVSDFIRLGWAAITKSELSVVQNNNFRAYYLTAR